MTRLRERRDRRILMAASRRPVTTVEAERIVRKLQVISRDPAVDGLRTRAALTRLDRAGLLTRTPHGWTVTAQGRAQLTSRPPQAAHSTAR